MKASEKKSQAKSGNKIMLLNFKEFHSHFSKRLQVHNSQAAPLFPHAAFFSQGVKDAIDLVSEMYSSGRLDLTYRNEADSGINNISDYEQECVLSDEVDLDELEYPLFERFYYSGVKQFFECMNRDFKIQIRR